ncbi:uncharacterized protein K452DRAFT_314027 [Aplosporella prunicola CBS 121167]|uniref:CMP/dCMP-type deaminase domain-containing protein n=1 Tax=Aplosporella prunicola CBS 121167 TaxID=1176127 RepID=A0A6A6AUX3_9PEZI|nr:uncharacterized protein K452DRAFT_314027 [Aplosporella prunicola CBS 121167]KAF2135396.1 hypothetical protein K452DRAFT_314027 [Aplosporella prunicola CBS 121167]
MKTDNYLALCLEQAALSPLHHRHGSIVVRGGKVIGHGYNDYRRGYDGGALKTGQLATKPKPKPNSKPTGFTSLDAYAMGGGCSANAPLSMHAEMMAIRSALATSSALAATAVEVQKPCAKLPGAASKRGGQRLRDEAVWAYVERVCAEVFGAAAEGREWGVSGGRGRESQSIKFGGRGRKKPAQKHRYVPKSEDSFSRHTTIRGLVAGPGIEKDRKTGSDSRSDAVHGAVSTALQIPPPLSPSELNSPTSHAQNRKKRAPDRPPNHPKPILVRTTRSTQAPSSYTTKERTKHAKLHGADLYVARLGHAGPAHLSSSGGSKAPKDPVPPPPAPTPTPRPTRTGSLHEELTHILPAPPPPPAALPALLDRRTVQPSRPCYRCVAYLHAVGIKRVYWTNSEGEWEGAKVRELAEGLEGGGAGGEMFVTKGEVLRLRRGMGALRVLRLFGLALVCMRVWRCLAAGLSSRDSLMSVYVPTYESVQHHPLSQEHRPICMLYPDRSQS